MPGGWFRRKSTSGGQRTAGGGGTSERAKRAKAKLRQEWWDWWFTPRPGAVPPEPKPPKTSKPAKPQGKKKRASGDHATAKPRPVVDTPHEEPVEDRETLAWRGPSDLAAKLKAVDDEDEDVGYYDECGFPDPSRTPDPTRTLRVGSTNETARIGTGLPSPDKEQSVPEVSGIPADEVTAERAAAMYLRQEQREEELAQGWVNEAQYALEKAAELTATDAETGTNEHEPQIAELVAHADDCDRNAENRRRRAAEWAAEAANPLPRIKAMTGG